MQNRTCVDYEDLERFCREALSACGADEPTQTACTNSIMHGSIHGVDSHGVRLLPHYIAVFETGRLNRTPNLNFTQVKAGTGILDGDNAQGGRAMYAAMDHAIALAQETGIAGVAVQNSSHFGPAGAYSIHAARAGMIGLTFGNSDAFVRLHDGAERFHGTNPISMAVPTGKEHPWLLDMATSSVPVNRVQLYASLGVDLPDDVASDTEGVDTNDPNRAEMMAPVGAAFGFKGAALGGMAEIFSAVLSDMRLSPEIAPMGDLSDSRPREMGAFVMAIDPDGFVGRIAATAIMDRYLSQLRSSKPAKGKQVMAPGDREWAEAAVRREKGVPLDPVTVEGFEALCERYSLIFPKRVA
jgi:LDH2 family malate/lactate/ureidoglycolate dehydrogenase